MNRGDKVQLSGYDLMAVINYASADSKAVVVHNNSTHILLFRVDDYPLNLDLGDMMKTEGVYVASYRYFPTKEDTEKYDFIIAYKLALDHAIQIATGEASDGT